MSHIFNFSRDFWNNRGLAFSVTRHMTVLLSVVDDIKDSGCLTDSLSHAVTPHGTLYHLVFFSIYSWSRLL